MIFAKSCFILDIKRYGNKTRSDRSYENCLFFQILCELRLSDSYRFASHDIFNVCY